ncbi:MAG TPA: HIT domain-containing protein [Candidatus Paceibacterota bacterium]
MENCVFCKIVKGEIPSHKVYEDSDFMAILDIRPESPGHALVIPRQHYRWVWDVPNAGKYFEAAQKIALAQKKAFGTDLVISKIMGEEVPHAHIWVYPDKDVAGDKTDFAGNAEKIRKAL